MNSRVCSPCPHKDFVKPHPVSNAKSSMFMRVRRTVPQFTFILSERFVNRNSSVSTGFFRFFPVLFEFEDILPQKSQQNDEFTSSTPSSHVRFVAVSRRKRGLVRPYKTRAPHRTQSEKTWSPT